MHNHFIALLAFLAFFEPVFAVSPPNFDQKKAALSYVERHAFLAIREMESSGIPASITLAQALVETGNGLSRMATEDLNHFGIKCHKDWQGDTAMYKDDDRRNGELIESCFRSYASVEESYADRSAYLKGSKRYAPLFVLERTDYRGWAYGLKECGYATSATYAEALIRKIEELELWRFDDMASTAWAAQPEEAEATFFEKGGSAEKSAEVVEKPIEKGQILGELLPERAPFQAPPPEPLKRSRIKISSRTVYI